MASFSFLILFCTHLILTNKQLMKATYWGVRNIKIKPKLLRNAVFITFFYKNCNLKDQFATDRKIFVIHSIRNITNFLIRLANWFGKRIFFCDKWASKKSLHWIWWIFYSFKDPKIWVGIYFGFFFLRLIFVHSVGRAKPAYFLNKRGFSLEK